MNPLIQQPPTLTAEELEAAGEWEFAPGDPDGLKFLAEQEEAAKVAAEAVEQAKYDAEARRRQLAADNVRREREQAEISGTLAPEAELFYEALRAKVTEAHDFQPTIRIPVVQGLFNQNSLSWVAGSSGTFKSFMTADLAFRYGSDDMDYHGRKMTHGRALIIVAEGDGSYADRKTAWERQYNREVKNVAIYPGALQLADIKRDMAALLYYLRAEEEDGKPFGLIVIDTQAMCTVGIDENSSEMNLVINVLNRIRQTSGACVMPVHHFGKDASKGMRGSTVVYAAADTVLVLKRDKDSMVVDLSTAQADGGKQKDNANEADLMRLEMKIHDGVNEDYFGDPVSSLVAVPADAGHDVTDSGATGEMGPDSIPEVTDVQLFYLQALSSYEEDGAAVTRFEKDVSVGMALDELSPPAGHTPYRQAYDKNLRALRKKGMVEKHPKYDSRWRVTSIGAGAIMRELKDRDDRRDKIAQWAESPSRRRVQGTVHEPLIDMDSEPE